MKNTYKSLYDNVKPDDGLAESVFDVFKKKKKKNVTVKIVSACLAFTILLTSGIYGVRTYNYIYGEHEPEVAPPNITYTNSNVSNKNYGFVMVANAAEDENIVDKEIDYSKQKAELNTLYEDSMMLMCVDAKGMSLFEKKKALKNMADKLCYSADSYVRTENLGKVLFGYSTADYFRFSIPNPDQVKIIRISNESKYGIMQILADDCSYDDNNVNHQEYQYRRGYDELYQTVGNNVSFSGERYAKNMRLSKGPRYHYWADMKEYSEYTDFYPYPKINWLPSDELREELKKNPDMDFADISDTITFEVEFKNGDIATSVAEIQFDSDGMMSEKLVLFEYKEK